MIEETLQKKRSKPLLVVDKQIDQRRAGVGLQVRRQLANDKELINHFTARICPVGVTPAVRDALFGYPVSIGASVDCARVVMKDGGGESLRVQDGEYDVCGNPVAVPNRAL